MGALKLTENEKIAINCNIKAIHQKEEEEVV